MRRSGWHSCDDPHGAGEVAQAMAAQIGQPGVVGELVFDHFLRRGRDDGLAAVREVAYPGRLVDRRARVVAFVAQLHITGVNADAQLDRRQIRSLQFERACHRVTGPGECGDEAVALTLFDGAYPAVLGDELRGGPFMRAMAPVIASGWLSHNCVEPSTSASSSVTVPVGSSSAMSTSLHSVALMVPASAVGRGETSALRRIYRTSTCGFTVMT